MQMLTGAASLEKDLREDCQSIKENSEAWFPHPKKGLVLLDILSAFFQKDLAKLPWPPQREEDGNVHSSQPGAIAQFLSILPCKSAGCHWQHPCDFLHRRRVLQFSKLSSSPFLCRVPCSVLEFFLLHVEQLALRFLFSRGQFPDPNHLPQ